MNGVDLFPSAKSVVTVPVAPHYDFGNEDPSPGDFDKDVDGWIIGDSLGNSGPTHGGLPDPVLPNPMMPGNSDYSMVIDHDSGDHDMTLGYEHHGYNPFTGEFDNSVNSGALDYFSGSSTAGTGSSANSEASSILSNSSSSAGAADYYLDLYRKTGENSFLEKYIDILVNRENTQSARDYETQMSNTAFSRLVADIQKAGYNPWIALQGGNMASTPGTTAASGSMVDALGIKTSKDNNVRSSLSTVLAGLISAIALFATFAK